MKEYPWQKTLHEKSTWTFANERAPQEFPFGCFTRDDDPLSGRGWFEWCQSPHELLTLLREMPPRIYGPSDAAGQYKKKLNGLLQADEVEEAVLSEPLREELCKLLRGAACIDWWGRFEDLLSGQTEFAQGVREEFWEYEDEEKDGRAPVGESEVESFIEFLSEYGT